MNGATGNRELVRARQEGREALTPWLGWLFGPMAWALHQGIGYAMVPWLCRIDRIWPYHALTAFALGICAVGVMAAFAALRQSRRLEPERSRLRMRMMALVGLMLCAAALGGIAVEHVGLFWLDVCAHVD